MVQSFVGLGKPVVMHLLNKRAKDLPAPVRAESAGFLESAGPDFGLAVCMAPQEARRLLRHG